jgi:hypothetical protein
MELDHIADENGAVVGQQEVLSAMPRSTARPAEEGNITEAVDQRPHQGGLSRRSVKIMSGRGWEQARILRTVTFGCVVGLSCVNII